MKARADYILGNLLLSGRIPVSAIKNAVIINYGSTGIQNGHIEFRLWDADNGIIYIIKYKDGLW